MLISEEYRAQIVQLHKQDPRWGTTGRDFAPLVRRLVADYAPINILDYGCGKQTLAQAVPEYRIKGYDPALPGLSNPPEPHDLVLCTDVLEHIEPACLDDVLDDLQRVARKNLFAQICTVPAKHILPDGRNAHLIVQPARWWLEHLWDRFDLINCAVYPNGLTSLWAARTPRGNGKA